MKSVEKEVQKEKSLAFWLIMLVVLFVGVFGIFMLLEVVMPKDWEAKHQQEQEQVQMQQPESGLAAPNFCPFCGDELPESFAWGQYCPFCGENVAP